MTGAAEYQMGRVASRAAQSRPMMNRGGKLLGILTTQWDRPYRPDEHDLWRIDLLVRQAADLIEQARVEGQVAADLEAMTRLREFGSVFVREGNLEAALGGIVETAMAITGADFGSIQLLEEGSGSLRTVESGLAR